MAVSTPLKQQFQESDAPGPTDPKHLMHRTHAANWIIAVLATYGIVVLAALVTIVVDEFPKIIVMQGEAGEAENEGQPPTDAPQGTNTRTNTTRAQLTQFEVALLKLVLSFGALGGLLHLLTSLGRFVGSRRLERSWALFYLLRPPVGAVLGLLVYLILRMSALGQGGAAGIPAVNVYGVLAFSGLAGMFSRQAIEKLAEAFDVLFQKTKQELEERPIQREQAVPEPGRRTKGTGRRWVSRTRIPRTRVVLKGKANRASKRYQNPERRTKWTRQRQVSRTRIRGEDASEPNDTEEPSEERREGERTRAAASDA